MAPISHVGGSAELAALFGLLVPDGEEVMADFEQRLRNVAALYPGVAAALPQFVASDHVRAFQYRLDLLPDVINTRIGRCPSATAYSYPLELGSLYLLHRIVLEVSFATRARHVRDPP